MRENESSITRRKVCAAIGGTIVLLSLEGCFGERSVTATDITNQMQKWNMRLQELQQKYPNNLSLDEEEYVLTTHQGKRINYKKAQNELVALEYSEDKGGVFPEFNIRFSKTSLAWKTDISYSPKDVPSSEWYLRSYTTDKNPMSEKSFRLLVQNTDAFFQSFNPTK